MALPAAAAPEVFPTPVFEGSEKRIEIDFAHAAGATTAPGGLRSIARQQLDAILDLAACCIVSARHGKDFDAYVLSESSLFLYARKAILKTCGTTKLLAAVPALVEAAVGAGLEPCRAKYSRASYLFPEQQPEMHAGFTHETRLLQSTFATMGGISGAYVLGDALRGLQWHVFVAHSAAAAAWHKPAYTLEVCMTGLDPEKAAQFARGPGFISAEATTEASGIRALLPDAKIDDYVFEPCGYSMNGMVGPQCSTIHITPEDGFSYSSVEVSCQALDDIDAERLVGQIADIFRPTDMAVVTSVDGAAGDHSWGATLSAPAGYTVASKTIQDVSAGGRVTYVTLAAHTTAAPPAPLPATLPVAAAFAKGGAAAANETDAAPPARPASPAGSVASDAPCPPVPQPLEAQPSSYSSDSEGTDNGGTDAGESTDSLSGGFAAVKPQPFEALPPAAAARPADSAPSAPAGPYTAAMEAVMVRHGTVPVPAVDVGALDGHIGALIKSHGLDDTFYVLDLGVVAALAAAWTRLMPRVRPFYAVKCNGDPALLEVLAAAGACFDCASEAEIQAVVGSGVAPDRIIFANACKRPSDIRAAKAAGVAMTTADSESELRKIAELDPSAQVLLRIRQDDPSARCQLGNKYGAEPDDIDDLLAVAKELGLDLAGVSFHVGSGASNPDALPEGIAAAAAVFVSAERLGFAMRVLDIGGGFPGGSIDAAGCVDLGRVPSAVNAALEAHFPPQRGVDIIAEPGRFFAEACATLVCQVFGRRKRSPRALAAAAAAAADSAAATAAAGDPAAPTAPSVFDYYITDGLYGSFNCVMYDHAEPTARPLRCPTLEKPDNGVGGAAAEQLYPSTVFGPSCDGLDTLFQSYPLPELHNGDWLAFPDMGAYTLCGASNFNGINAADAPTFYVRSELASS